MSKPIRVLHVGKSGRAHVLAEAVFRSAGPVENTILCDVTNPGLRAVAKEVIVGRCDDPGWVAKVAAEVEPDLCIPGPEEPLAAGVVDRLLEMGIPSVGPCRKQAQLESSKAFTRSLLDEFGIPGNPRFRIFAGEEGLGRYLRELGDYVVKPDGLTGGKGVRLSGDHLPEVEDAVRYCRELFAGGGRVVIEEKLLGEEFTLQSFCDGRSLAHMIPAQDHKRKGEGDTGPNTGGMGSYSCADQLLPFLERAQVEAAQEINTRVAAAVREKTGKPYKGILYGSFIRTRDGVRVIEYNARFGDPEVMNVLSVLETDFLEICLAIVRGQLERTPVAFAPKATVCKYVVPEGYPEAPVKGAAIRLPAIDNSDPAERMYYGAVKDGPGGELLMTGSRAVAFVGIGDTLAEAERRAEAGAAAVQGPVWHRRDIGAAALIARRVEHMGELLAAPSGVDSTFA
ncbi:MAG TPA: phosphoribosylamine--glycine ligase [Caulobacteraceae bacterium]|nr:phosphoribosylamine--glycine ligase [Caulobacteraceae bacterium]